MHNPNCFKPFLASLCFSLAMSGGVLQAQSQSEPASAGPNRPAGVPASYVITPNGYFHPSCVKELASGDTVLRDQHAVRHANGTVENITACPYAHYGARGQIETGEAQSAEPPQLTGWIEDIYITTSTSFGGVVTTITVPSGPDSNDGQTVFFFPGLEDINVEESILQPVLGWNAFSNYPGWSIASWNYMLENEIYSSPVGVSTGDLIIGEVMSNCSAGTLVCPTWFVLTEDANKGTSTELSSTSSYGQTFNLGFLGVLEVEGNGVVQCSDYPPSGSLAFPGAVYDENFKPINQGYTMGYGDTGLGSSPAGLTPQCNYGGDPSSATIYF